MKQNTRFETKLLEIYFSQKSWGNGKKGLNGGKKKSPVNHQKYTDKKGHIQLLFTTEHNKN